MHGKAVGKSFQPHLDLGSEGCWAGGPGRKGGVGQGWAGLGWGKTWLKSSAAWLPIAWQECWRGVWSVLCLPRTPLPQERWHCCSMQAARQHSSSPIMGGQHPEEPRIHWISSRSDPQSMDSCSHRREGVGSDTLRPQARVRGDALPVNCFCLMNCSFFSAAADKSN